MTAILHRNLGDESHTPATPVKDLRSSPFPPGLLAAGVIIVAVFGIYGVTMWWHDRHGEKIYTPRHSDHAVEEAVAPRGDMPATRRPSLLQHMDVLEPSMKHLDTAPGAPISFDRFDDLANDGELDVYTCFGVAMDNDPYGKTVRHYIPTVLANMALQVILPVLLAVYQVRTFKPYSANDDWMFRSMGFLLYLYSVWHMYQGALDKCRSMLLRLGMTHTVSGYAMVPMLLGELANALLACTMIFTLFSIFCSSTKPTELIINCVAMNFIVSVDNNFCTVEMKDQTIKYLRRSAAAWSSELTSPYDRACREVIFYFCQLLRVVGTLLFGGILAFMFYFASQKETCKMMRSVEPWPFCLGIPA